LYFRKNEGVVVETKYLAGKLDVYQFSLLPYDDSDEGGFAKSTPTCKENITFIRPTFEQLCICSPLVVSNSL
jgi:hypothetical protein